MRHFYQSTFLGTLLKNAAAWLSADIVLFTIAHPASDIAALLGANSAQMLTFVSTTVSPWHDSPHMSADNTFVSVNYPGQLLCV